jgi:hypothetical protein
MTMTRRSLHLIFFLELLWPELHDADEAEPSGKLERGEDVLPVEQQLVPDLRRKRLDQIVLPDGMILDGTVLVKIDTRHFFNPPTRTLNNL